MTLQEQLLKSSEELEKVGAEYAQCSLNLGKLEEKFKLIRAKVFNLDAVQRQPNQVLRESEADVIMQNDKRFQPLYEKYQQARLDSKTAWIQYDVRKEINSNLRVLVNNLTFGKDVIDNA